MLAAKNYDKVDASYRECAEHEELYWKVRLDKAQDQLQRAIDNYNSETSGPICRPEESAKLDREDAVEDEPILLAQSRFDGLAEPYSEEVHRQLWLLTSKGSKNTRRRNQEQLAASEREYQWEINVIQQQRKSEAAAREAQRKEQREELKEARRLQRERDEKKAQADWERYLPKLLAKQEAQMPQLRAKYIAEYPKLYQQPVENLSHHDLVVALYFPDSYPGRESESGSESIWDDDELNSEDEVEETLDQTLHQAKALNPRALAFVPGSS